jgi:hypothetical protein
MRQIRVSGLISVALLSSLTACMHSASTQPSAMTPPPPRVISASSKADIDSAMPTVIVTGVVDNVQAGENRLTINFKDTKETQFYAIALSGADELNKAFGGDLAKAITAKAVRVTGHVVLYRGKPEIVISSPDQLSVDPGQ